MKKKILLISGLLILTSTVMAKEVNLKIQGTEIFKTKDCTSYVIKADKLEQKYNQSNKSSYRLNTNRIINIDFLYTKFLTCQKLKEMNN